MDFHFEFSLILPWPMDGWMDESTPPHLFVTELGFFVCVCVVFGGSFALARLTDSPPPACNWMHLYIPPVMHEWAQWPQGAKASGTVLARAPEDCAD